MEARALAEFAASRPASADRAQGEPGAMSAERWAGRSEVLRPVSEWAVPELAVALSISEIAAESRLERALTLVQRLPGTLAALEAGALHAGHVRPMLELVARIADPVVRAEVEAGLLRWAAGRVTTPAQLRDRARREVARREARTAARRFEKALRRRGVHLSPEAEDGLAAVTVLLTEPEAQVFYRALGEYADQIADEPDNPRTRQQKMADCLMDLVLRPDGVDLVQVRVLLTVVASIGTLTGGDEVGEIGGRVVPAEMIRELLRLLGPRRDAAQPDPVAQPDAEAQSDPVAQPDPGAQPVGDAAAGEVRVWSQAEQDEYEARLAAEEWWGAAESRLLAVLDDLDPEPVLLGALDAWGSSADGAAWMHELAEWGRSSDELERRILSGELALLDPDRAPPPGPAPGPGTREGPPGGSTSGAAVGAGGWWSAADRAVDDASLAVRRAGEALGHAGRLVRAATAADAEDEAAFQAGPGRLNSADDSLAALRACSGAQRQRLAELLDATGGGGLLERPRLALTDALTGALLSLTDLPELRRTGHCGARACRRDAAGCTHELRGRPGLGPPGPTDGYRPAARLDRFLRARDRRCRQPGCRRPVPRGGELDHNRPHPLGPTSAGNLTGFCTGHHRGKHQAPGWRYDLADGGSLTVTTPTGLVATTEPPPF